MSESLRKKIIFATLPLAILWAVFNYGDKKSTGSVDNTPAANLQTIAPITAPQAPDARLISIEDKQAEPWGKDPFRTTAEGPVTKPKIRSQLAWVLGGIIYSHQAPVAFVNKQMVRVGDRVGEATVVSINKKTVILDFRGRRITLKLNKG